MIHPVAAVTHPLPIDCLRDLDAINCSSSLEAIMSFGLELIAEERQRQIESEGWTDQHDDGHYSEELARAAACYATPKFWRSSAVLNVLWPWRQTWWKPTPNDRIRELAKAGALIAAEIDRLHRGAVARESADAKAAS